MVDLFELFERDGSKRNPGERRKGFRGLLDRVMNVVDGDGEDDDDGRKRDRNRKADATDSQGKRDTRRDDRESFFDD